MPVKVLICDDQEAFRTAAREVVDAAVGFEVVGQVETGEESVVAADRLHPDLVLMDVHLPGIDGLEATRRIREQSCTPPVVVLLSTWDSGEGTGATESGAAEYIPKSRFGPDRLALAWRRATTSGEKEAAQV